MAAGWVGLLGIVASGIGLLWDLPKSAEITGALVAIFAGWTMLFTRTADEYTRGLWNSGASFAFATLLILFLGLPFAEGFIDGMRSAFEDRDPDLYQRDIPGEVTVGIAIGAFYIGLFWKRVRGGI